MSIQLYGCTTWTLTKQMEKKLDGNYTRMLQAILNKSWRQHPSKQQLYGHLPPIMKTIKVRRIRHAGHYWRSRDEFISDVLLWTPSHGWGKARRPARTYIQQLCEDMGCSPETCQKRWTIGWSGERGSGISMMMMMTSTTVLFSQNQKFHHDRTAKMSQEVFTQNFNSSPGWLIRYVLEGIDALSFVIKLQDGRVIQCDQTHMRACFYFSEPMSPTPVNYPGLEKIESRLLPQLDTALQVPIHTPDEIMPENPPVQKSTVAMSTPLRQSSWEVEVPQLTVAVLTPPWRSIQEIREPKCFSPG